MQIVTLTLHPARDRHAFCETPADAGREIGRYLGGKGINVSRALKNFGIRAPALAYVGEDEAFVTEAKAEGIPLWPLYGKGQVRVNQTRHFPDGSEEHTVLSGAKPTSFLLGKIRRLLCKKLIPGDILCLCGSLPDGLNRGRLLSLLRRLRDRGIRLVCDCRNLSFSDLCALRPFLIKPNLGEASALAGRTLKDRGEAALFCLTCVERGIGQVLLSLGKDGALLADADGVLYQSAPAVQTLSTIGAGDAALAGFLLGLSRGETSAAALSLAVAFGSAACLSDGTCPPRPEDVSVLRESMGQVCVIFKKPSTGSRV